MIEAGWFFLSRIYSLQNRHYPTDNHHHIDDVLQGAVADSLEEAGADERTDDCTREAYQPPEPGAFGIESGMEADKGVAEVDDDREGLQGGDILALVVNRTDAIEYQRWARHGKHAAHHSADASDADLCELGLEDACQPTLAEHEVQGDENQHNAQPLLHGVVAQRAHVLRGEIRGQYIEQHDSTHQSPTDMSPVAYGNHQGGATRQQARKHDGIAIRGQEEREEHHDKDAEPESADTLDEAGDDGEYEYVE